MSITSSVGRASSDSAVSYPDLSQPKRAVRQGRRPRYVFVFIEVLGCEGGIQSYIKDILTTYASLPSAPPADVFLLRDRVTPDAIAPFEGGPFRFYGFKSDRSMWERVRLTLSLGATLWRHRPARVFCGHINLANMVSQLCSRLRIPYTVLTYGKEVWESLPTAEQQALAQANDIWTISRYSRDLLCAANHIAPAQVKMLPCVVDGAQFTPALPSAALKARYGLDHHQVLMTVARLWKGDPYKGVDVTIRALPQIAAQVPDVRYLVIGRGDDQPRLAQLAEELGVADRVIFAGFVPTAELVDHYRLADVYVMPSKEGFGIVYLEAMACGVPVIAGDDDGSADPLQDGRLGWQVPHRDPAAVTTACLAALAGKDPRCCGDWLREQALSAFGATALTHQLQDLLADAGAISSRQHREA
ncbi:MAG: glycosyltransferase family 4 protein [Cyanobacteria bacterium J06632_22]